MGRKLVNVIDATFFLFIESICSEIMNWLSGSRGLGVFSRLFVNSYPIPHTFKLITDNNDHFGRQYAALSNLYCNANVQQA